MSTDRPNPPHPHPQPPIPQPQPPWHPHPVPPQPPHPVPVPTPQPQPVPIPQPQPVPVPTPTPWPTPIPQPQPVPTPTPPVVITPPAPKPGTGIDWMHLILAVIAALLGGYVVNPTPPKPPVVPPPVVVTPPPVNPPVTPPVTPPSTVTITDSKGNVIQGNVQPGQQFIVTAPDGTTLTPVNDTTQAGRADFTQIGNKVIATLTAGYRFLIVVTSKYQPPTLLTIQANQAPQPPPDNPPPDNPPPVNPPPVNPPPNPPEGSRKFTLTVVEDPKVQRSVTTASILNNLGVRKQLTDKGHKFTATTSTAVDPAASYVRNHPIALPALVIFDATNQIYVKAIPLPTDLGLSAISELGG